MTNALLTGASGLVGSCFLADYLRRRPEAAVWAIMRPAGNGRSSRERLSAALARALHAAYRTDQDVAHLLERVHILEWDLASPVGGFPESAVEALRRSAIGQVWHAAGDLKALAEDSRAQTNVMIARNAALLAAEIASPRFIHISTAYVFGRMCGEIVEGAEPPERLVANNPYERGKLEAERAVRAVCAENGLRLTILRPTIVIGHSQTKAPAGSANGLYGVARRLHAEARRRDLGKGDRLTLYCGTGRVNLVPIDRLVDCMCAVADSGVPAEAVTVETVAGTDVDVATLVEALEDRLGVAVERVDAEEALPPEDRAINRRLAFFRPYTEALNEKRFAGGEIEESHRVHDIDVLNYVEAGLREAAFGGLTDLLRVRRIERPTGSPLVAYESVPFEAGRSTAVIVNAYGMPIDVMQPLVHDLVRSGVNVLSWDCRGLPDQSFDVTAGELSLDAHVSDWALLSEFYMLSAVDLIGWSTGAVVAARVAASRPAAVRSLVLLHGSYMHPGAELTQFQQNLRSIMPKIAASRAIAKMLYNTVFKKSTNVLVRHATRSFVEKSEQAMNVSDPAYKHLVQMLTHGPEEVFRYARLIQAFMSEDPRKGFADIRCPITMVTGTEDSTAHPRGTYDLGELNARARVITIEGGDHFSFYGQPEARRHVVEAVAAAHASTFPQKAATRS